MVKCSTSGASTAIVGQRAAAGPQKPETVLPRFLNSTHLALQSGVAFDERVAAEMTVRDLPPIAVEKRQAYMRMTAQSLRDECSARMLFSSEDMDRNTLIDILEDHDGHTNVQWVQSKRFEAVFLGFVCVQAMVIGLQIDSAYLLTPMTWTLFTGFFFIIFTVEALLKVTFLGLRDYIVDPWHLFDILVLTLTAAQLAAVSGYLEHLPGPPIWTKHGGGDLVQILRLCRLVRLARYFKDLGVLIQSFISSVGALGWILLVLFIWFYLAACIATVFIGHRSPQPFEDKDEIDDLRDRFRTIPMSMFALFEVMTLEGWVDYVRPILKTRMGLVFFFLAFIFITAFFMLNLVTAVVVDRTVAAQQTVDETITKVQFDQRSARISFLCGMLQGPEPNFGQGHEDGSHITLERLQRTLNDPDVRRVLRELGWSNSYLLSMFDLVDHDSNGSVSLRDLKKLLEVSHNALDTTSYVRFQFNLARRLEFQESLVLTALNALELMGDGKFQLPSHIKERMKSQPLLQDSTPKS